MSAELNYADYVFPLEKYIPNNAIDVVVSSFG